MSDDRPGAGHNSNRFTDILYAATQLQAQLEHEGYADEDVLGALESETEVLAIVDRTIEKIVADERLTASARERARRLEARADMRRGLLNVIMTNLRRQNLERPLATVYYATDPQAVIIDNADDIPEKYLKSAPDKAMIARDLKAGTKVAGAHLADLKQSLRIKVT